ncbi:aspartic proteinase [Trifolium repens]|nr:aspartic proteinase [Trifolium repens]
MRLLLLIAVFLMTVAVISGSQGTLRLERVFPSNHGIELNLLKERDLFRHAKILKSSKGIVHFPVLGNFQDGLYFTSVKLGTPPGEYLVQIDTGSDALWVSCASCNGCSKTSGSEIKLHFFDPKNSSTSSLIDCSDRRCKSGIQSSDATCHNNQCSYTLKYGDVNGTTTGYYVSDTIHFEGSTASNSSAPVVFGCSNMKSGDFTKSERALDGVFGFGHQKMSVISQLSAQGITPRVFSHCLRGDPIDGGGLLVLGAIVDPTIVYTPLVPSQPHYNLNLQSISVNGHALQIDASVFATSKDRGTIVDSGTTLAYLAEEAYDPFVNAITAAIPHSVRTVVFKGYQCFLTTSSVIDIFPQVSLNFAGGASLNLRPRHYLIQQNYVHGATAWCIGFLKIKGQGVTILGDLVLKDKIVVYDLDGQRVGWADYDCSSPFNASAGIGNDTHPNAGNISENTCLHLLLCVFIILLCAV